MNKPSEIHATPVMPEERQMFEAACRKQTKWPPTFDRSGDGYKNVFTQTAWEAWQDRAALAATALIRPSDLVNGAHILASDSPAVVVRKLDAAFDRKIQQGGA